MTYPRRTPALTVTGSPSLRHAAAYKSRKDLNLFTDQVQLYINKLLFFASWGFTISTTKTVAVLFTRCLWLAAATLPLSINGQQIHLEGTCGICFKEMHDKCFREMHQPHDLHHWSEGGKQVLRRIYNLLIMPILDFGCVVWDARLPM